MSIWLFARLGREYARLSTCKPFSTASATAASILLSADFVAQSLNDRPYNLQRTFSLTVFGAVYYGFPCKLLYMTYDRFLGAGNGVAKMVCDVYLHTPLMLVPSFYCITGALKGQGPTQIWSQLKAEWFEASLGSICFWTPAQLICFKLIPQHSRILFVALTSFFHKVWLSHLSNRQSLALIIEPHPETDTLTKSYTDS